MRQGLWDRRLGGRRDGDTPLTLLGRPPAPRLPAPSGPARAGEPAARRTRRGRALVLAASLAAGLGGGASLAEAVAWLLTGDSPRLAVIAVRGSEQLTAAEIAAATGLPRGIELRRLDPAAVAARLAESPWIARVNAVELPSGRLIVEVTERRAVATVSARGGAQPFAVDASGTPFAPARAEAQDALPRLVLGARILPGEPDPELARAVDLAGRIEAGGLPRPHEIGVAPPDDPTGFWLRLSAGGPRVLLGRDQPESRLGALARLLEADLPEAAQVATLDLRFADQVVLRGKLPAEGAAVTAPPHGGAAAPGAGASGGRGGSKPRG
jgi:cell division protein FtsQ